MSLRLHMKAGRLIAAPKEDVWQAFCRLTGFNDWEAAGGPRLALGLGDKGKEGTTVQAKLVEVRPGELVAIAGRYKKIKSLLVFAFTDLPRGTKVEISEALEGWALLWARRRYSPQKISLAHQAWLRELEAEVMTQPNPEPDRIEAPT